MRRVLLLLATIAGIGFLLAAPAEAHATVVTSTPADGSRLAKAPSSVTITFDEPVGLAGIGYLHVTDGTGRRVDAGIATHPGGDGTKVIDQLVGGLGDSTYTASYRVISADSHPVAGTIRFVVGDGALARGTATTGTTDTGTQALFDVARWATYGGLALLGGSWLLLTVWGAGRAVARARRIVWTGWTLAAVGAVAELLLQGPYTAGDSPAGIVHAGLLDDTLRTHYGQLHSIRLVLLGAFALLLARVFARRRTRVEPPVAAALGLAILWTVSAGGHAGTTAPAWLSIVLDMAHLAAMAAWVGGLVLLVAVLLPRCRDAELRAVLTVFSPVAFWSVAVLAASGTYAAWRGIDSLDAVLGTTYGLLVIGKVVLFAVLIALGNLSRQVTRRRWARPQLAYANVDTAPPPVLDTGPVETERLRRSVYVETVVALVVLALTSVLVAQPRGPEALAAQYREPVSASTPLGANETVTVTADPGTHGTVQLTVDLAGVRPTAVSATATQTARQLGPLPITLRRAEAGRWGGSVALPVAGAWRIDLVVTTSAFDATTADVVLTLH